MTGENWPQIMQDLMVVDQCYYVKEDYVNANGVTIHVVRATALGWGRGGVGCRNAHGTNVHVVHATALGGWGVQAVAIHTTPPTTWYPTHHVVPYGSTWIKHW